MIVRDGRILTDVCLRMVRRPPVTGDIGQNIRDIRIALELSTSHVAEAIGLSRSYYAQLETGKRKLSADHVRWIADVLEVPWVSCLRLPGGDLPGLPGEARSRRQPGPSMSMSYAAGSNPCWAS